MKQLTDSEKEDHRKQAVERKVRDLSVKLNMITASKRSGLVEEEEEEEEGDEGDDSGLSDDDDAQEMEIPPPPVK